MRLQRALRSGATGRARRPERNVVNGLLGALVGGGMIAVGPFAGEARMPGARAEDTEPASAIVVRSDGSVTVPAGSLVLPTPLDGKRRAIRCHFGLPQSPPESRMLEDGKNGTLPICRTSWVKDGIRYIETVLVTRLHEGDLMPGGQPPADAVLVVQVAGECLASEYTEATAAFAVEITGVSLNLQLCDGIVYAAQAKTPAFLAAIDIPASGIENTNGCQLRFRASMPPGTSGAMTVKIPTATPKTAVELDLLRDLTFDDELRRVKRFWKSHPTLGPGNPLRATFGD